MKSLMPLLNSATMESKDSHQAMMALAKSDGTMASDGAEPSTLEGNLRAMGESKIERTLRVPEARELVASLSDVTERAGFEPAVEAYTPTTV